MSFSQIHQNYIENAKEKACYDSAEMQSCYFLICFYFQGFQDSFPPNGLPLRLPMPLQPGMGMPSHISPTNHTPHHNHAGSLPDLSNLGFNHNPAGGGKS